MRRAMDTPANRAAAGTPTRRTHRRDRGRRRARSPPTPESESASTRKGPGSTTRGPCVACASGGRRRPTGSADGLAARGFAGCRFAVGRSSPFAGATAADPGLVLPQHRELVVLRLVLGRGDRLALLHRVVREQAARTWLAGVAELVHLVRHRRALVVERDRVAVLVDRAERLVHLDVLAVRQALDDAGLDAVLEHRTVRTLQAEADPVRHVVGQRRHDQQADAARPRRRVQRDVELQRDDVVDAGQRQDHVERDRHRADAGADRGVARALQQVVVRVVAGQPLLDERVGDQQRRA